MFLVLKAAACSSCRSCCSHILLAEIAVYVEVDVNSCADAVASGVHTINGTQMYCDADTAGGGWQLVLHTGSSSIPGPLAAANGDFDPLGRRGAANLAVANLIGGFPVGTVELAIAWGITGTSYGSIQSHTAAVSFMLPIPVSGHTFLPSPNGNCLSSGYTPVEVSCLHGSCGDLVGTMYTGGDDFGVCYGNAYGLVRSNGGNAQCDWTPDTQDFSAIYIAHTGHSGCRNIYQHGSGTRVTSESMSMWVRMHRSSILSHVATTIAEAALVNLADPVEDPCTELFIDSTFGAEWSTFMRVRTSSSAMQTLLNFRESMNLKCQNGRIWCHARTATSGWTNGGGNTAINDGAWHTIAMTYDGNAIRFYHDGVYDGQFSKSGAVLDTGTIHFGCRVGGNELTTGTLADLLIFNTVLTESQIRELSNPCYSTITNDCGDDPCAVAENGQHTCGAHCGPGTYGATDAEQTFRTSYGTTISQTNVVIDHTVSLQALNSDVGFTVEVSTTPTDDAYPRSAVPLYFTRNPETAGHVGLSIGNGASNEGLEVRMGDGTYFQDETFVYGHILPVNTPAIWRLTCVVNGAGGRQCSVEVNGQPTTPEHVNFAVPGDIYSSNGGVFGNVWGWRFIGTLHYIEVLLPRCIQCLAGQVSAGGPAGQAVCLDCLPGQYQNEMGQTNCTMCAAGTYEGRAGQASCTACAAGQYGVTSGQTAPFDVLPEWLGDPQWVNPSSTVSANTDGGTSNNYNSINNNGAMSPACVSYGHSNCAANMVDGAETTIWHCDHSPPCEVWLDLGIPTNVSGIRLTTFQNRITAAQIQYSADGSSWSDVSAPSMTVPAPSPAAFTEQAFETQVAQYWRLVSITATGDSWVAVRELELLTRAAGPTDMEGSACIACPTGRYQDIPGSSNCTDCSAGFFANGTGSASVGDCTACPAGQYQAMQAQTNCTGCAVGRFFAGTARSTLCPLCAAGQSQSTEGQASCANCVAGRFAPAGATSCTTCPLGQYQGQTGQDSCIACTAPGHFTSDNRSSCLPCPGGTVDNDVNATTPCAVCLAGYYAAEGTTACVHCPAGYHDYDANPATPCDGDAGRCPAGTHTSIGSTSCPPCPGGTADSDGDPSTECAACAAGRFAPAGATTCTSCVAGTADSDSDASTECVECEAGTTAGVESVTCMACPLGFVQPSAGQMSCVSCVPGRYDTDNSEVCTPCASGFVQPASGRTNCSECPAGRYDDGSEVCAQYLN
eukprot:SAG22_NODE_21_length_31784_cov_15.522897_25_plen_1232_part_00